MQFQLLLAEMDRLNSTTNYSRVCCADCAVLTTEYRNQLRQVEIPISSGIPERGHVERLEVELLATFHSSLHLNPYYFPVYHLNQQELYLFEKLFYSCQVYVKNEQHENIVKKCCFLPSHELLLFFAIMCQHKPNLLKLALKQLKSVTIPKCVLYLLFIHGVRQHVPEFVQHFLEREPSIGGVVSLDCISSALLLGYAHYADKEEERETIFRKMFQNGSRFFGFNPRMFATGQKIADLALLGPVFAEEFIAAIPDNLLGKDCHFSESLLLSALRGFRKLANETVTPVIDSVSCRHLQLYKVLKFVVLPLLQSGANLDPDPFEVPYRHPLDLAAMQNAFYRQLIIELRRNDKYDDDKARNLLTTANNSNTSRNNRNETAALRLNFDNSHLSAFFPRPLSAMARRVILDNLPVGLYARKEAIHELQLPRCLQKYLNFEDLESFEIEPCDCVNG